MLTFILKIQFLIVSLYGGTVGQMVFSPSSQLNVFGMDFGTFTSPKNDVDYGSFLTPAPYPSDFGTPNVAFD